MINHGVVTYDFSFFALDTRYSRQKLNFCFRQLLSLSGNFTAISDLKLNIKSGNFV
jgi:hypothetical protein